MVLNDTISNLKNFYNSIDILIIIKDNFKELSNI